MQVDLTHVQKHLEWLKRMLYLDWKAQNSNTRIIKRGQVYHCDLGIGVGSEIQKTRPCVIVQNDIGNIKSSTVTVVPVSHTNKKLVTVVPIATQFDEQQKVILDGFVNVSAIQTVDKARLQSFIALLSSEEMKAIEIAIAKNLSMFKHYSALMNQYQDKLVYIQKLQNKINRLQGGVIQSRDI